MDPVDQTPTEPTEYAALSALYGTLLAGAAYSARNRPAFPGAELPALAASPTAGRTVATVLAASAGNDLLQAAFKVLCVHTNAGQHAETAPAAAPTVRRVA